MGKLNKDIYLLGTGIKGFSHITLETNYILKNCNEVYYVNPVHSLEAYLKKINPKSFNLIGLYKDFRSATDVYEELAQIIIKRAKEISKISFLSHGNPIIFSTPSQIIIKKITRSLRNKPHRFKLFKQYLLKFYPEEHIVYLIESAVDYTLNPQKIKFPISDIEKKASFINTNSSLYIPAVKGMYIRNKKFYSLINNPNNINELVYQGFKK
jgi:uncharacterized protein YabN with tetrapyrrole methylase and pyrophosphatase domain